MKRFINLALGIGLLGLVACSAEIGPAPTGELELITSENGVEGSYLSLGGEEVVFESIEVEPGVVEIVVEARDMILMATMDTSGVMDLDVFARNGDDTQILEADRALLDEFSSAIFDAEPDSTWNPIQRLERLTSLWGSWPETNVPTRLVLAEENRSYSSLCGYVGWYINVTHDGPGSWVGGCGKDNWGDSSTFYGLLNNEGAYCGGDGTRFSPDGGSWTCYEPDHSSSQEYARGLCFGQCGSGCGSPDYTIDCADHDSCVRFGHATVSISCNDEFSSTVDDWGFSPVCG